MLQSAVLLVLIGAAVVPPASDDDKSPDEVKSPEEIRLARERDELRAMQPKIDAAIDKGVEHILSKQRGDGTWGADEGLYPSGQTALCVYTLLKADLSPQHPAVAKGLLAILARRPRETYSAGCQLMALEATGDIAYRQRMSEIRDDLIRWQERGLWSYPEHHGGIPDLSNTQYAALGLRACRLAGLEVPRTVWMKMLDAVYRASTTLNSSQRKAIGYGESGNLIGFRYRTAGGNATGSMTSAGIAILQIGVDGLGLAETSSQARKARRSIDDGIRWLAVNFTVSENPFHQKNWLYYYLYGLERIGSFLAIEHIGQHNWYLEGAKFLVDKQADNGSWKQRNDQCDTCFGVLFLKRASFGGATTGAGSTTLAYTSDPEKSDVHLRGTAPPKTALWVTGFSEAAIARAGGALYIEKVEYTVDDKVIETVEADPTVPWNLNERYAVQHQFQGTGDRQVSARVYLSPPPKKADADQDDANKDKPKAQPVKEDAQKAEKAKQPEAEKAKLADAAKDAAGADADDPMVLTSSGFVVAVDHLDGVRWKELSRGLVGNRVPDARAVTEVSTRLAPDRGGEFAVDGDFATRWISAENDEAPWIRVRLRKKVQANTLVLAPAAIQESERGQFAVPTALSIRINGARKPMLYEPEGDPLRTQFIPLEKLLKVQSVVVEIVGRTGDKGAVGFSEIGLIER